MEKPSEGSSSMSVNDDQECNKANDDFWSRVPRGIYFQPSDEELINDYLYRKVNNLPFPLNKINEADVYSVSPDQLISTGNYKQYEGHSEMYFFTSREREYPKGKRPRRDGWWKATGSDKIIHCVHGNEIGRKKVLVFHNGKDGLETDWVMHEYDLSDKDDKNDKTKFERTVLCKIYKKPDNAEESVMEKLNHPLMEVEDQIDVPAEDPMNLNNPENVEIPLNNDVASDPMYVEYSVNNSASATSNGMTNVDLTLRMTSAAPNRLNLNNPPPVTNAALNQRMTSASPNSMTLDNWGKNVDLTLRMTSAAPNRMNLNNLPPVTNAALNQRMTSASPNPMELDNWGKNVDLTLRMASAAPNRLNLNNPPPATIAALNQQMTSAAPNLMKLDNQMKNAAFNLRMTSKAPNPMDLNKLPPVTIAAPNLMKLDNQVKNAALNLRMTSAAPYPVKYNVASDQNYFNYEANNPVANAALNQRMTSAAPNRLNLNNLPPVTNAALNQRMTSASPNRLNLNNPPPATIAALNQRMASAAPNLMKLDNQMKNAAFNLRMTSEAPNPMDLNNLPPVTIAAPNPMKLDNQVTNAALNLRMTSAAPNPVKYNVSSDQNYFNYEANNLTSSGMNLDNPVTNASSDPITISSDGSSDDDE